MEGTMKKLNVCLWLLVVTGLLSVQAADGRINADLSTGQTVYVPVYSHIYQGDRESPIYLAVTLSIRNVDPKKPIMVLSADYYDSKGDLLKIEMFAHGALCMAVSGKCYLSLHENNASANRGNCLQTCRRSYKVIDDVTGDELAIDNEYVMSPKDLCTIGFIAVSYTHLTLPTKRIV